MATQSLFSPLRVFSPRKLRSSDADETPKSNTSTTMHSEKTPLSQDNGREKNHVSEDHQSTNVPEQTPIELGQRMMRIEELLECLVPSVQQIQEDVLELKTGQNQQISVLTQQVSTLEDDLKSVKNENLQLKQAYTSLNDRINKLESYSRRKNLLLFNVPESQAPLINTVRRIISDTMKVTDSDSIILEDIRRLGASRENISRPILFRI